MKALNVFARLIEVILNAINRKNKKDASDGPAEFISDRVQQSDKSFKDLAAKSKRDRAE